MFSRDSCFMERLEALLRCECNRINAPSNKTFERTSAPDQTYMTTEPSYAL